MSTELQPVTPKSRRHSMNGFWCAFLCAALIGGACGGDEAGNLGNDGTGGDLFDFDPSDGTDSDDETSGEETKTPPPWLQPTDAPPWIVETEEPSPGPNPPLPNEGEPTDGEQNPDNPAENEGGGTPGEDDPGEHDPGDDNPGENSPGDDEPGDGNPGEETDPAVVLPDGARLEVATELDFQLDFSHVASWYETIVPLAHHLLDESTRQFEQDVAAGNHGYAPETLEFKDLIIGTVHHTALRWLGGRHYEQGAELLLEISNQPIRLISELTLRDELTPGESARFIHRMRALEFTREKDQHPIQFHVSGTHSGYAMVYWTEDATQMTFERHQFRNLRLAEQIVNRVVGGTARLDCGGAVSSARRVIQNSLPPLFPEDDDDAHRKRSRILSEAANIAGDICGFASHQLQSEQQSFVHVVGGPFDDTLDLFLGEADVQLAVEK